MTVSPQEAIDRACWYQWGSGPWMCTLDVGHAGPHEAWGALDRAKPLASTPQAEVARPATQKGLAWRGPRRSKDS